MRGTLAFPACLTRHRRQAKLSPSQTKDPKACCRPREALRGSQGQPLGSAPPDGTTQPSAPQRWPPPSRSCSARKLNSYSAFQMLGENIPEHTCTLENGEPENTSASQGTKMGGGSLHPDTHKDNPTGPSQFRAAPLSHFLTWAPPLPTSRADPSATSNPESQTEMPSSPRLSLPPGMAERAQDCPSGEEPQ